jgi:hypothetical protein
LIALIAFDSIKAEERCGVSFFEWIGRMAATAAAAPLRRRSYFKAGEKNNKKETYDGSPIVLPKYGRNSNYESSNAASNGVNNHNSRPQLRIPKAKYAGEIHKANEEPPTPQVTRNFHTDYATMEEAYDSTMEEFAPHFREIDDDEKEAFETSILLIWIAYMKTEPIHFNSSKETA